MQTFQLPTGLLADRSLEFTSDGVFLGIGRIPFTLLSTVTGNIKEIATVTHYRRAKIVRDGRAVAHISSEKQLVVTAFKRKVPLTIEIVELQPLHLTASPNGNLIYVAGSVPWSAEMTEIHSFDALTLESRGVVGRTANPITRLVISADSMRLAIDGYGVSVWNISTGKKPDSGMRANVKGDVNDFALSADGEFLGIAESNGFAIWNTRGRRMRVRSGKHRRSVDAVACSPLQPLFLTGDGKGKVFMWDETGRVLKQYDWRLGQIAGLAFAPDGLRAAALDFEGKVVIWDVDT